MQRAHDPNRLRVLTFTTLYPNASQPNHGVFVENRLRHLVGTRGVDVHVVAPVPWFPWQAGLFGRYAALARTPRREVRFGVPIVHPRYPVIPRLGMSVTPASLFLGALPTIRRMNVV